MSILIGKNKSIVRYLSCVSSTALLATFLPMSALAASGNYILLAECMTPGKHLSWPASFFNGEIFMINDTVINDYAVVSENAGTKTISTRELRTGMSVVLTANASGNNISFTGSVMCNELTRLDRSDEGGQQPNVVGFKRDNVQLIIPINGSTEINEGKARLVLRATLLTDH